MLKSVSEARNASLPSPYVLEKVVAESEYNAKRSLIAPCMGFKPKPLVALIANRAAVNGVHPSLVQNWCWSVHARAVMK